MFESLDERMKHDVIGQASSKEQIVRYLVIALVSVVVIAALFEAVRLFG